MQADNKISQGLSCFFLTVAVLRLNLDFIMRLKASELEHIFFIKDCDGEQVVARGKNGY